MTWHLLGTACCQASYRLASAIHSHYACCSGAVVTGAEAQYFFWASIFQSFANDAGNCSLLASQGDAFRDNSAAAAGGIIFATDLATLKMSCTAGKTEPQLMTANWTANQAPCEDWQGNHVGLLGYGADLASLPSTLTLDLPFLDSYVSNGSNKLAFTIRVQDQAGTQVTPGHLSPPAPVADSLNTCQWP